jgi:Alkyl sulfatase C-terminal
VATVEQCEQALHELSGRLANSDSSRRKVTFDRTMTCAIRDLDVIFSGRLKDGQLIDIGQATSRDAQVRLTMSSDDLLALVAGQLKVPAAWATGRIKVEAGVRDLLTLRKIF